MISEKDKKFAEEKAQRCVFFYYTPLATLFQCKKTGKVLSNKLNGIPWTGEDCLYCRKWKMMKKGENK